MQSLYGHNKDYLSFSAIEKWFKNKDAYRRDYYEEKQKFENKYTRFGKEIHEKLETDKDFMPSIDRTGLREQSIDTIVDGVRIKAYVDHIDLRVPFVRDYKTGKTRWTPAKVQRHEQLPFYSLLAEIEYGIKINKGQILWLETDYDVTETKMNGVSLITDNGMKLTGNTDIIERRITQADRNRMRAYIRVAAKEIADDYAEYVKAMK